MDTQMVAIQKDDPRGEARPRANIHGLMPLKDICCAKCGNCQKVGGNKLHTITGFSMVKCKTPQCEEVQCSSRWHCRCNTRWIKCPRHVLNLGSQGPKRRIRTEPSLKAQRLAVFGEDKPLPLFRKEVGGGRARRNSHVHTPWISRWRRAWLTRLPAPEGNRK